MDILIDDSFEFHFNTFSPSDGSSQDADAAPTWAVYEEGVDTPIATGTCAKRYDAGSTGAYIATGTVSDALYDTGKRYWVKVTGTATGDGDPVTFSDIPVGWFAVIAAVPAVAGDAMDIVDAPNATAITTIQSGLATAANQTTILARLGAWTGTGVNTVLGAMKSLLSKTASVPSDIGGTFAASTDSTEAIRDKLDTLSAGSGAKSVVVTVVDGDADPVRCDLLIPGVASGITNASTGALTLMLDPGTYSVSLGPAGGYTFSNPYTLVVSSSASQTATLTCDKVSISDPAGSGECKVYGYVYDQNNEPVANAVVKVRPYGIPALTDADGIGIQAKQKSYLTNSSGYFEAVLLRSSSFDPVVYYEVECDTVGYRKIVEVPDESTVNWYDLGEASV